MELMANRTLESRENIFYEAQAMMEKLFITEWTEFMHSQCNKSPSKARNDAAKLVGAHMTMHTIASLIYIAISM